MIPARVPSRERVRQHACPLCKAKPGQRCADLDGRARPANHAERIQAAQAWLGTQLTLEAAAA